MKIGYKMPGARYFGYLSIALFAAVLIAPNCKLIAQIVPNDRPKIEELTAELAKSLATRNQALVERYVLAITHELGGEAGTPEKSPKYTPIRKARGPIPANRWADTFEPYLEQLSKEAWWQTSPEPYHAAALRAPAAAIEGVLAARRAGHPQADLLLQIAKDAGAYLLKAQQQGGRKCFPFPYLNGTSPLAGLADKFISLASKAGKLDQVLRNGWIVDDLGQGEIQYDNGLAGSAMFSLYQATGDKRYLKSGIDAADWALSQPSVVNWNYNSFSVFLLANAYRYTREPKYLEGAKEKTKLGILPGQILDGPNKGRWNDPHNAQLVYHFIIIRGLGALVGVMSAEDPDLPLFLQRLRLALYVRNEELLQKGFANPETVLEVLSRLELYLPARSGRLPEDNRGKVLHLLGRELGHRLLERQQILVSPNAWGLYLEVLSKQGG